MTNPCNLCVNGFSVLSAVAAFTIISLVRLGTSQNIKLELREYQLFASLLLDIEWSWVVFASLLRHSNLKLPSSSGSPRKMSGEQVLRPEKDFSSEVDKQLPEAEELAKVLLLSAIALFDTC